MKYLSILMVCVALLVGGCGEKDSSTETEADKLRREIKELKDKQEIIRLGEELAEAQQEIVRLREESEELEKEQVTEEKVTKVIQWRNGVAYTPNSETPFTGTWTSEAYANGQIKETYPLVEGIRHGMRIWYYPNGSKMKETPYVKGSGIHGTAIWYLNDGTKREENWVRSTGTWIECREDGSKEKEIPYENGYKHGTEIEYFLDGSKRYEFPYVNGKKHGTHIEYNKDGSKWRETPYVDDKEHGTRIRYYDGSKKETPYVDGKIHGTEIEYREDGSKKEEIPYENGYKHGTQIFYLGRLGKRETVYENGKMISSKLY
jgi:antitoxin component YwqK of YwqJK toxin-antitoxin module